MAGQGIIVAELVFAVAILLVLLTILLLFTRRRVLSRGSEVVTCGLRQPGSGRWQPGLLRMGASELQAYPLFGWTTRAVFSWERYTLDLSATSPLVDDGGLASVVAGQSERPTFLVAVSGVTHRHERMPFELALGLSQYTALRYWVESSPPIRRSI